MNEACRKWDLEPAKLPKHVGIIMDGNGRWAKARHLPRVAGHRKGVQRVRQTIEMAAAVGIESLTLFAFSDENWRRPEDEVGALMNLLRWYLRAERKKVVSENLRFRMIGDRKKLSTDIIRQIEDLERETQANTGMWLTLAISYGGRGEILRATKKIAEDLSRNKIHLDHINEDLFMQYLDTAELPPVDLVIRTSGEMRISNFLLWQAAYAEFVFEEKYWPDFDPTCFAGILRTFSSRERRFGMVSEQLNASVQRGG